MEPGPFDEIIELYKKDIDLSLLRENLKLTVEQRFEKAMRSSALPKSFAARAVKLASASPNDGFRSSAAGAYRAKTAAGRPKDFETAIRELTS